MLHSRYQRLAVFSRSTFIAQYSNCVQAIDNNNNIIILYCIRKLSLQITMASDSVYLGANRPPTGCVEMLLGNDFLFFIIRYHNFSIPRSHSTIFFRTKRSRRPVNVRRPRGSMFVC